MARAVAASHHSHHALNHRLADTSGSLKEDERKTPKEVLLEIPPPEDRVLGGKWEKMTITGKGVRWQPKYAVLTKSTLGFAKMITGGGDDKEMSHWMHSKKLSAKDWELEQIFKQFDANGNGELDVLEVQACLEHMKLWSNGEDIQSLFDSLDTDNSASIDIDEFKQLAKWAHATNFVVEYIPLEDISGIEYEIVDIGRKRSVLGIESQETMISRKSSVTKGSIKQCIDAIESILGIDIDGDGEDGSPQLPAWNEATHEFHLRIMTAERGHNSGKTYVHRVSQHDAQAWWELLNKTTRARQKCVARMELEVEFGHSRWALARALTHRMYQSNPFQYTTAFFILMAFALDICESQVLPAKGTYEERVFMALDASLTAIFTAELLVNIFAHSNNGFRPFYTRGWNWFDAFIVIVSLVNVILSYSGTELPNAKILRMLRLARAVRLFSALKDLQRLLAALSLAIYPVCNAFLILLIVASMYAILATTFFSDRLPEYFGDFSTSLFTMFQILSFDSWASGISRGLFSVEGGGNGFTDPKIALFFVSYILVNSIMLLNLVVAVLLDEFITSVEMQKEAAHRREEMEINKRKVVGCLDPLTSEIITFVDGNDLLDRIDIIWAKLDFDNDGQLGFEEFQVMVLRKRVFIGSI
jgi:voltage-gated sodium channel